MQRRASIWWAVCGCWLAWVLAGGAEPQVLATLLGPDGQLKPPGAAPPGMTVTTVAAAPGGKPRLHITVVADFAWRRAGAAGQPDAPLDAVRLLTLCGPFLPPTADAVRLRVRVSSGRAILAVGGPVSQVGNSDVFCDPQLVDAADGQDWRTVELSLNQRLARNFRRPNFTSDLPVVYYTRWAQEPLGLYLVAPPPATGAPTGVVLDVEQIELLACGEGQPAPKFAPADVTRVATIADFAGEDALAQVVTVAHGAGLSASFAASYRRAAADGPLKLPAHVLASSPFIREEGLAYPAPRYTRVPGPPGVPAVQAEGVWAEEGQIVTLKTPGKAAANALSFAIKPNFPTPLSAAYTAARDGQALQAVDLVVFVAPAGGVFPWRDLEAAPELQQALRDSGYQGPGGHYEYLLAPVRPPPLTRVPLAQAGAFAFYSARCLVPAGQWSTVIVPCADFICVYGQGACQDLQRRQMPLAAADIAAVGFLLPFGSGHGTLALADVAYVQVPGTPAKLRSYWQVPDPAAVRLTPLPRYRQYQRWLLMTLGAAAPAFLLDGEVAP